MKKTNNRGFSLVELILAIAILAIIMIAVASFMGTTTRTYTKTKNDIEVQEKGQEIFDSISDKLMQATCIRIGTTAGDEYYSYPSENKYEFSGIDDASKEASISYISMAYERKNGAGEYETVVDTYYYNATGKQLYMERINGSVRTASVSTSTEMVETPSGTVETPPGETLMKTAVKSSATIFANSDLLVGSNIEGLKAYVIPKDNSVHLILDMQKQGAENEVEGIITIRNNYVLKAKKEPASTTESPTP